MTYVLTDDFLTSLDAVRIGNTLYTVDLSCKTFAVGDTVLDRQDGTHATIDSIRDGKAVLKDGWAIEIGVPLDRLVKLSCRSH